MEEFNFAAERPAPPPGPPPGVPMPPSGGVPHFMAQAAQPFPMPAAAPQSMLDRQIATSAQAVEGGVNARMAKMVQRGESAYESLEKYAGINEEEILTFVPDRRDFSGAGPLLLGLLALVLLPGASKLLALLFFTAAVLLFWLRYVNA